MPVYWVCGWTSCFLKGRDRGVSAGAARRKELVDPDLERLRQLLEFRIADTADPGLDLGQGSAGDVPSGLLEPRRELFLGPTACDARFADLRSYDVLSGGHRGSVFGA